MINLFGLILTVLFFKLAQRCKGTPFIGKFPPILLAGIGVILVLKIFNIDFDYYNESASFLTMMLIPATIALGYPIYKHKGLLIKNKRIIYSAFFVASIIAICSTYITSKFCNADFVVIESLLPKSVTAPIAIEITRTMGGIPELTMCVVVMTGVFGAIVGHKILEILKVKSDIATGLALGAASHVIGTSRCAEKGREKQVVMASLALVLVGVITAVIIPVFINIIK